MLKIIHILTLLKTLMIKMLNFKLVIMLEYQNKNIFAKGYTPKWSEEVFVISKNILPRTQVINDLIVEEIIGTFYEKELQKMNQKEFNIEKVIKRKGNKLYIKQKGYDNSFNSWIDKKDLFERNSLV